jgi:hypothetical protein
VHADRRGRAGGGGTADVELGVSRESRVLAGSDEQPLTCPPRQSSSVQQSLDVQPSGSELGEVVLDAVGTHRVEDAARLAVGVGVVGGQPGDAVLPGARLAVGHDPVRYRSLIASRRPQKARPTPPHACGHPPSLNRPPANLPWRTDDAVR